MNFLQLCQETDTEVGTQAGLATVVGATGYDATIVHNVKRAWEYIQTMRTEWEFMKNETTFSTVAGTTEYTLTDIFGSATDNVASYRKILYDKKELSYYTEDKYNETKVVDSAQSEPKIVAIDHNTHYLYLNPPDAIYTVEVHYFSKPQILAADADIPTLPTEYHQAIVMLAAMRLGGYLNDITTYDRCKADFINIIGACLRTQNPSKSINLRGRTI